MGYDVHQGTNALPHDFHGSCPSSFAWAGSDHFTRREVDMTDAQKIRRILQALDDRARGLLDAEGLVETLLAILAGRDPYAWDRGEAA